MQKRVLIVDDDGVERQRLHGLLTRIGYHPIAVESGLEALALLDDPDMARIDAVILDLVMPDLDGMAVLARIKDARQTPPVIMMMSQSNIDQVSTTIRAGALDFIVRPAGVERLSLALSNALRRQALELAVRDQSEDDNAPRLIDLIANSPAMQRLVAQAQRAARSSIPVLITGPHGSGKARLARAIHRDSDRWGKVLLRLDGPDTNPADLSQSLENCLALKGAMLITHIGQLDEECQTVLAEAFAREAIAFTPGGPKAARKIRLYATSPTDLTELSREGGFRADLAMRLAVQPLRMPGLNERHDDLLPLIEDVLARSVARLKGTVTGISAEALSAFLGQDWSDNIRGLTRTIRQAVTRAEGPLLTLDDCDLDAVDPFARNSNPPFSTVFKQDERPSARLPLSLPLTGPDQRLRPFDELEADILKQALLYSDHHIGRAASALGIGRSTFYRKAKDFGLLDTPDLATDYAEPDLRMARETAETSTPRRQHPAPSRRGEAA